MSSVRTLALAGVTHDALHAHLFPGDGNEAAAILVCARSPDPRCRLVVRQAILVPHDACSVRTPDAVVWPGSYIEDAIDVAEPEGLAILLLHSHRGGWLDFSPIDDASDATVLPGIFEAFDACHGSAVMTPDGAIRARLYSPDMRCAPVDLVTVAGDDILYWWSDGIVAGEPSGRALAFTGGMSSELSRLSATVVGVSGTGSIAAEQLARLGFGNITLVDFDMVETKNLNRILNATTRDAEAQRLKVDMFAGAIASHRGEGIARKVPTTIATREAICAVGQCDVVFCCVDTQEGRYFADLIASAFLLPLFDVGVTIPTHNSDGRTSIADVCGRIDYVQPGGSTLGDREVHTPRGLRAEYLQRVDPQAFSNEVTAGYIKGVTEQAPAVITLNMRAASMLANEFIARAYPFRLESNRLYARTSFSLAACEEDYRSEDSFPKSENRVFGLGATEPLLGLLMFQTPTAAAA
ncbi:ThiF family adenylyltransferase [Hyphomicrobium sp.]|uniref:ThiF family adenylyltransferase n=1 Tax=Hyphomicrobium sp. TaxID=82 RepID=UPI001E098731|nr:ThiF family adenylyltransferase [Hyphomicrobium sp.]MBY0560131.1 ThiF family adenylyltransferase [Hyphomicrobium sp.]